MLMNRRAAVFFDRDGTLNVDHGYVSDIEQFDFIEGSIEALIALQAMGFALVLVSNQSGIARGLFSEQAFMTLTEWMDWSLADRGVDLDGIYYCPHHPAGKVAAFRQQCDCRKPQPGMLLSAAEALNIDMAVSYMVGDKLEDMQAGAAAGIGCKVLVRSGQPLTLQAQAAADWVLDGLTALPQAIQQATSE